MYISIAWAFKDDDGGAPVKDQSQWRKRLSKTEFLKLPKPNRERYLKLYPHSSHRFLMGGKTASKEDAKNIFSPSMTPKENTGMVLHKQDRFPTNQDIHHRRREVAAIRRDIHDYNKSNVAVINPQSLQALDTVKDAHLREASDNIRKNKNEIASVVALQAQKQPVMYNKGLTAVADLVSGKVKPDDMRTTEKHAMQKVLSGVATMALFGAGIMVMGMCAAPLGVLAGRLMFDMWAGGKHGKNLRADIDDLRRARDKRRVAERKAEQEAAGITDGMTDDDDDGEDSPEDIEKRLKKRKEKEDKRKGQYTAAASDFNGDDHSDTINLILDQVSDIMQYHTARDFQANRDEMFATASSEAVEESLRYLLNLANCNNYEKRGDGIMFDCNGSMNDIQKMFTGMGYIPSVTSEGDSVAYHFENDYARASLGRCDDRYYIRYDGDFDYRKDLTEEA